MLTKTPKIYPKFVCENCKFTSDNKKDYSRHILTAKHQKNITLTKSNEFYPKKPFLCECNKEYKSRVGLWQHNKICKNKMSETPNTIEKLSNIVLDVVKQNQNLQKQLIKLSSTPCTINNTNNANNTNNTNNTNNNKFNLNIYLNETCKDAINIGDFVNQIQLTMVDFENFATLGYVQNISNIFIRQLKLLDKTKRPILCSDAKREVIYIKDQNVWEKDENNQKTIKTIKKIARDNSKQSDNWLIANPKYYEYDSKENTKHSLIMNEAMGGNTLEEDVKNYDKIVRNVIKEVAISKC